MMLLVTGSNCGHGEEFFAHFSSSNFLVSWIYVKLTIF